tara:strand:+ start:80 stop:307 length:228 start_codon:yes stop_codon:yes gene_type:complete
MYTLTLIRLNSVTRVFENTEYHSPILLGELENELAKHHTDFKQVEEVLNLQKGERITVEVDNGDKLWFYYINRIS